MRQKITMRIVEQFIEKHPNGKNIRGLYNDYTYFNVGGDETGEFPDGNEVRPGCLFGHIVKALGGGPKNVVEDRIIDSQEDILSSKLSGDDISRLRRMQEKADGGMKWSQALEWTKEGSDG